MDKVVELPRGYKERTEALILRLHGIADRLWSLVGEFDCDKYMSEGDGYILTLEKKEK